jgi:hypothetical protein
LAASSRPIPRGSAKNVPSSFRVLTQESDFQYRASSPDFVVRGQECVVMSGFLKTVLSGISRRSGSSPCHDVLSIRHEQLQVMSFPKLLTIVKALPLNAPAQDIVALVRRSYNIALYDHHVPNEHREAALALAEALTADLEKGLAADPKALAALKDANNYTIENARQHGYGSLAWMLQEHSISNVDTIPYVMKPNYRHLVPDFLEIMRPQDMAMAKQHLVRQLIEQSEYNSNNSVLILHGLAAKGDAAMAAILTPDEYGALLNVSDNYAAGRDVLVSLGLLPAASGARSFEPLRGIEGVVALILKERNAQFESDSWVLGLQDDRKLSLLITLNFLRVELMRGQLSQIYDEEVSKGVTMIFRDDAIVKESIRFRQAFQELKVMSPGTPVDLALLDLVMSVGGCAAESEAEFRKDQDFLNIAVTRLNMERVEFLDYFRFMLRAMSSREPKNDPARDERIAASVIWEICAQNDAYTNIADKVMYYEDRISSPYQV